MKQNFQGIQPFFAQFLTAERNSDSQHNSTLPSKDYLQTHKYPSDNDEEPPTSYIPE